MKKLYFIFIAFTLLIMTNCNIPDEASDSDIPDGESGTTTTNTVSFNESIAYILESTTDNPIPNLEIVMDNPAEADITFDLAYSDANISGSPNITILQGASAALISLSGNMASPGPSTLTASYNSIDVASTQIRVYGDAETRDIIELNPATQNISVLDSGTLTVFLNLPAPTGGVLVNLSSMGNVTIPASTTINTDSISADFTVTAGGTAADDTVTASYGVTSLDAIVHVLD